jgi:hypothetical protein
VRVERATRRRIRAPRGGLAGLTSRARRTHRQRDTGNHRAMVRMVTPPVHKGTEQRLCDSRLSIVRTGFLVACGGVVLGRVAGTVSVVVTTADEAAALEAEAEEYPDERGEILLEAAKAWRRAGESGRYVRGGVAGRAWRP